FSPLGCFLKKNLRSYPQLPDLDHTSEGKEENREAPCKPELLLFYIRRFQNCYLSFRQFHDITFNCAKFVKIIFSRKLTGTVNILMYFLVFLCSLLFDMVHFISPP